LNQEFEGLKVRLGTAVIPALTDFLRVLNQGIKVFDLWLDKSKSFTENMEVLSQMVFSSIFGGPPRVGTGESKNKPTPEIDLSKIPKTKKPKEPKEIPEFFDARDIRKLQNKLAKEELDRELTINKLREDAERKHLQAMEELNRDFDDRTIAMIERDLQERVISEQQAAEQIGAIRIAAFKQREDQLREEIRSVRNRLQGQFDEETRQELLAEEQKFTDELEILQERRAAIEEEAVNRVIDARRKDIENLIETQRRMREARQQELQEQGFGEGAAGAIAGQEQLLGRTLTFREAFKVILQGIVDDTQATLPRIGEIFLQTTAVIADSLATMIAAFVSGQSSIRQVVAAFYKAALQPLVDFLLKKARIQFALGIADLADLNFPGAARHFLAGAALTAAAGLINAGGSAIAGTGAAGGT